MPSPPTTRSRPPEKYAIRVSVLRAAPARQADVRPRERPAHRPVGRQGGELVRARGDDEAAERRPGRLAVGAEQPLRAVLLDDPDAGVGAHEQPPGSGQREEGRRALLDADDLADLVEDGASRRAEQARECDERHGDRRGGLPRASPRLGLPLGERGRHERPGALSRLLLARDLDRFQLASHTVSFNESSPRRRRELTVPRGTPNSSAISPGVYPSRWRRTMTARWSGGSAASAPSSDVVERAMLGRGDLDEVGLASQLPRARPVDRPVDDDPVQPGPEGAAAVEAVEVAHGGEERLLRDVLGCSGVVNDEVRGTVGSRPVQPEQRLDPRGGAPLGGAHEGALVAARAHAPTLRPPRRGRSLTCRR